MKVPRDRKSLVILAIIFLAIYVHFELKLNRIDDASQRLKNRITPAQRSDYSLKPGSAEKPELFNPQQCPRPELSLSKKDKGRLVSKYLQILQEVQREMVNEDLADYFAVELTGATLYSNILRARATENIYYDYALYPKEEYKRWAKARVTLRSWLAGEEGVFLFQPDDDRFFSDLLLFDNKRPLTPVSFLIKNLASVYDKAALEDVVASVLDFAPLISYQDFILSVEQGYNDEVVAAMVKSLSLDETFVYRGKVHNLVSFLIMHQRYKLANDFYKGPEQAVPAMFQGTALDELLNANDVGPYYNHLYQKLTKDAVPVHFVSSLEHVPQGDIVVYRSVKERLKDFEINDVAFVQDKIERYREYAYSIVALAYVDDRCASYALKSVLNNLLRDKIDNVIRHSRTTTASGKQEYKYLQQQGVDADVAELLLTDGVTDLHSKTTLMDYRRHALAEKAKKIRIDAPGDVRNDSHQRDIMDEILRYAREGDWMSVRRLLAQKEVSAGLKVALLNIALSQHNFNEARYLLKAGATLPADVLLLPIYANDDAELANAAISLGADINYRDELGWSMLMRAIQSDALQVFRILLRNNVNPVQDYPGYDALDIALINYEKSQRKEYITGLLNYGYKIGKSHREIVNKLSVRNIEVYFRLAEEVPVLKLTSQ